MCSKYWTFIWFLADKEENDIGPTYKFHSNFLPNSLVFDGKNSHGGGTRGMKRYVKVLSSMHKRKLW